jgi:four helix bundle protein
MDEEESVLLKGYKKLKVWQESHELVLLVYQLKKKFPREELFGLTSQTCRAVVSIPANIVEGQARASKKEFLQFLSIANGSLVEVEYYLELLKDLEFITSSEYNEAREKHRTVSILLHGLIRSLRR